MPYANRPGIIIGAEPSQATLSPGALVDLLAMASRILAMAVVPTPPMGERGVLPPDALPYRAPAPKVVTTTKLPTALVTQQNPMLQGTTMRKSSWMIAQ